MIACIVRHTKNSNNNDGDIEEKSKEKKVVITFYSSFACDETTIVNYLDYYCSRM